MGTGTARTETRISLVLYGGVSLAVYISGACQELLSLVRATADPERVPDDQLTRSERVYRELARTAGPGGTPLRVTVDVLSGSSAGGLNAVFLGKALTHGGSLDGLTEIWRTEADFLALLNEAADPPKSLLSGDRFHQLLLGALDDMEENDDRTQGLVPAVDCYLTTTDLRGVAEAVKLHGTSIEELRRRARFHFRDGLGSALGRRVDHLANTNNDVLAFAARATAAHPAAFHPANWRQLNALSRERSSRPVQLDRFLSPAHGPGGSGAPVNLEQRWYSDGGAMDNKPFAYALEPLVARRADIPVERRVVYIEPDPSRSTGNWEDPRFPSLTDYTISTYGLARTENIRDDIAALNARNEEISRLGDSLTALFRRSDDEIADALRARLEPTGAVDGPEDGSPTDEAVTNDQLVIRGLRSAYDRERDSGGVVGGWTSQTRDDHARARGWGAVAQEEYRWSTVVTDLVAAFLQVGEAAPDPAIVRELVPVVKKRFGDWVESRYPNSPNPDRIGLVLFDVGYRLRRFTLLEHLISHEQRRLNDPAQREQLGLDDEQAAERFARATDVRRNINRLYLNLVRFVEEQKAKDFALHDPEKLGGKTVGGWIADDAFLEDIDEVADALRGPLAKASERGRQVILNAEIDESLRLRLADAWLNYGDYDQLILPLASVASAELDAASVIRISPLDADGLVPEGPTSPRKLGGNALGHFGGFLDENWRLNDILWGRLDTAEIVTTEILGASADDARRVQRAVLADLAAAIQTDARSESPTGVSPLHALLAVDSAPDSARRTAAVEAIAALGGSSSNGATVEASGSADPTTGPTADPVADEAAVERAADALIDLLDPDIESETEKEKGRWSVDLSTSGERGRTKLDLVERGAKLLGTTLARSAEDPFTGSGSTPPSKSTLAFVGRIVSWILRQALPTARARIVVWGISALLTIGGLAGLVGLIMASEDESAAVLLIATGVVGGLLLLWASLRRVKPLPTILLAPAWVLISIVVIGGFLVDWRATAAAICFFTLLAAGLAFGVAMKKLGASIVAMGNPKPLPPVSPEAAPGTTTRQ